MTKNDEQAIFSLIVLLRGEVLTFSIMQLTIADVNTTRTYHFEANEKDNSPNTEHLGFDTSQMAAIPKMHIDSRECDVTWQRPIGDATTSWSSLNMELKLFSTWDHCLYYVWLFLVRKSLVFESCGVFSLQEVGFFICYQPSSAMDSVWTLMYYR